MNENPKKFTAIARVNDRDKQTWTKNKRLERDLSNFAYFSKTLW